MKEPFKISVNDYHEFHLTPEMAAQLDIVENAPSQWDILRDGKAAQVKFVSADYKARLFTLQVDGQEFTVKINDHYDRLIAEMGLTTGGTQKQNTVKAPMPGLVRSVLVSPGQTVQKGAPLLVLEAMKMENVLKAAGEGVVVAVHAREGAAVEKGEVLIEME